MCFYPGCIVEFSKGSITSIGGSRLELRGQKVPDGIAWNDFCEQYGWPEKTASRFSVMGIPAADLELPVGKLHLTLHQGSIIGYRLERK